MGEGSSPGSQGGPAPGGASAGREGLGLAGRPCPGCLPTERLVLGPGCPAATGGGSWGGAGTQPCFGVSVGREMRCPERNAGSPLGRGPGAELPDCSLRCGALAPCVGAAQKRSPSDFCHLKLHLPESCTWVLGNGIALLLVLGRAWGRFLPSSKISLISPGGSRRPLRGVPKHAPNRSVALGAGVTRLNYPW